MLLRPLDPPVFQGVFPSREIQTDKTWTRKKLYHPRKKPTLLPGIDPASPQYQALPGNRFAKNKVAIAERQNNVSATEDQKQPTSLKPSQSRKPSINAAPKLQIRLFEDKSWMLYPNRRARLAMTVSKASSRLDLSTGRKPHFPSRDEHEDFPSTKPEMPLPMIFSLMCKVKPFQGLDSEQIRTLYSRALHKLVPRYGTILREGNKGNSFYLVLSGAVEVSGSRMVPLVIEAGGSFGEGALIAEVRREASVQAVAPSSLLIFVREDLRGIPLNLVEAKSAVISQSLEKVPFFSNLSPWQMEQLATVLHIQYYKSNEIVFREGDVGDKLYILLRGAVSVYRSFKERTQLISKYHSKSERPWFGEMALWLQKPRSGTACTTEPTEMLVVHAADFDSFLKTVPEFGVMFSSCSRAFRKLNEFETAVMPDLLDKGITNQALIKWQSAGKLGESNTSNVPQAQVDNMSKFAKQWTRLVIGVLYRLQVYEDSQQEQTTMSFETRHYSNGQWP